MPQQEKWNKGEMGVAFIVAGVFVMIIAQIVRYFINK